MWECGKPRRVFHHFQHFPGSLAGPLPCLCSIPGWLERLGCELERGGRYRSVQPRSKLPDVRNDAGYPCGPRQGDGRDRRPKAREGAAIDDSDWSTAPR